MLASSFVLQLAWLASSLRPQSDTESIGLELGNKGTFKYQAPNCGTFAEPVSGGEESEDAGGEEDEAAGDTSLLGGWGFTANVSSWMTFPKSVEVAVAIRNSMDVKIGGFVAMHKMNGVTPNVHFLPWKKIEGGEAWNPSPGSKHDFGQYSGISAKVETKVGVASGGQADWWMMNFRVGTGKKCKMYHTLPCTDTRQFMTDPSLYTKSGVIGAGVLTALCPPAGAAAMYINGGAMLTQVAVENGLASHETKDMCSSDLQQIDVDNAQIDPSIPMVINVNGAGENGIQLVFPNAGGTEVRAVVPFTVGEPIPCAPRAEIEEGQRVTLKVFNNRQEGGQCERAIQQAVVVHKYGGLEPSLHLLSYGQLRPRKFRKGRVQTRTVDRSHRDWWLVAYTTMAQPCVVKATVPAGILEMLVNISKDPAKQKQLGVGAAVAGSVAAADAYLNQYVGGTNVVANALTVATHGYEAKQGKGVIGDSDQAENLFGPLVRTFMANDGSTDQFFACDFEDLDADPPQEEENKLTRDQNKKVVPTIQITDQGCGDGITECVQFKFMRKTAKGNPKRGVRCTASVVNLRCATECSPSQCEGVQFQR